uniref:Uncharacterized protein n=1 Tax=Paramoeba aestuarina TaxID=180227 RepID=A0A7S4KIL5_9EUKA|mmetsp:Transcript_19889/g.31181  ORF Transcript_19889/g.31181 Transcript_19889/m.31181 type:complete len:123 (+) Transcript_19889:320-688(+)
MKEHTGLFLHTMLLTKKTFEDVAIWKQEVDNYSEEADILLVGNKCDSMDDRAIPKEEGRLKAEKMKIPFIETSAKNDINVDEAVLQLVTPIVERQFPGAVETKSPAPPAPSGAPARRSCVIS